MTRKPFSVVRAIAALCITVIAAPLYSQPAEKLSDNILKVLRIAKETFRITPGESAFTQMLPLKYIQVHDVRVYTSYWCIFQHKHVNVLGLDRMERKRMALAGGVE